MESNDLPGDIEPSETELTDSPETNPLPIPSTNDISRIEPPPRVLALERSGPIPDPETLKEYQEIVPGFAEQLLSSYLEESKHRRNMDLELIQLQKEDLNQRGWLIKANHQRSLWGLVAGFIISLAALGGAVYVTVEGYPWVGGIIGGTTVTALASVFVINKFQGKQQEQQDKQALEEQKLENSQDIQSLPEEKS